MAVSDIYSGNALVQPKSVADFDNEALSAQIKRQGIQANALAMQGTQNTLQQQQNVLTQRNALSQALQSGQIDLTNPEHIQRAISMAPDVAPGMLETIQKSQTARAQAGKDVAQASHANAQAAGAITDNTIKATEFMARSLPNVTNPQQLAQWYKQGIDQKLITPEQAQQEFSQIPINDPAAMKQWIANKAQEGVSTVEKLKMAQQAQIAADSNKTHLQVANIGAATSRSNNAATIAKDYKVAGIDPQTGNFVGAGDGSGGGMAGLVDAIGTGKVAQGAALSRMPPAMKSQVLAQVAQKYPDYDPTDMAQRNRAAVAFGTGKEGNSVRSFNVSLSHLDTLSNLADALNNRDTQLLNKVGNIYTQQTGSPAPTNFEAAKKIVTDEIVKAIVGSGGGVHDREAAADTISKASSPAQLKGAINTYKELMRGQLGGLERQYKATTGRDDFSTKFLSPEARAQDTGVNADLHSRADAILKGR